MKDHQTVGRAPAVLAMCLATGLCSPVSGEVIFNNFGAGDSFGSSAYSVGDVTNFREAIPFTPAVSYFLSSVTLGFGFSGFHDNSIPVKISIQSDAGGQPSGTVVESFLESTWALVAGGGEARTTLSASNPTLVASTLYWLVVEPTATSGPTYHTWGWFENGIGMNGFSIRNDLGSWIAQTDPTPTARIEGVEVPEMPSLTAVVAMTLVGIFSSRYAARKHQPPQEFPAPW